jgi:phosphoribosylanthranilate isomerase
VEPAALRGAADGVDAVLVDALVPGTLGGAGLAVDWERLAVALDRAGRPRRLVLAGGLRPENVERAIGLVGPDVVDVSSGVESTPGIKDHAKMRAFAESAARGGR